MEELEFRYDTQLLLDKYVEGDDDPDDVADDLLDEIRDYLLENVKGDSMVVAADSGEDELNSVPEFLHVKSLLIFSSPR